MKITHQGRSEAVNRALSDFGIEDSFARAAARFKEHYHYDIGSSAAARSTKKTAQQAMAYVENKLSNFKPEQEQKKRSIDKMLVELDGCEIRTAQLVSIENSTETTPVYNNPKKNKQIKWWDVRLGFARPLDSPSKIFVGKMDSYPEVGYFGTTPKKEHFGDYEIMGLCAKFFPDRAFDYFLTHESAASGHR
jgi:hypothetical protein